MFDSLWPVTIRVNPSTVDPHGFGVVTVQWPSDGYMDVVFFGVRIRNVRDLRTADGTVHPGIASKLLLETLPVENLRKAA